MIEKLILNPGVPISVSVIIPIGQGSSSPHRERLIHELTHQTRKDFELIFVMQEHPNGHARNVGVSASSGKYLVFIDETTSLGSNAILDNLLLPFTVPGSDKIGMTGTTIKPGANLNWYQKQYFKMRSFESPVVTENTESWQVQHPCMAIRRDVFEEVGGESDFLITGTDDDLRVRVNEAGYRMILVPHSICYYLPPTSLLEVFRKAFVKGSGSAYAFLVFSGLFPFAVLFGKTVKGRILGFIYVLGSVIVKTVHPWYWFHPIALMYQWIFTAGFLYGWFRYFFEKKIKLRIDLPYRKVKMGLPK